MTGTAPDFEPGPPQPVGKQLSGGRWTLKFSQVFPHPIRAVWSALTDPTALTAWAPYTADRDLGHVGRARLSIPAGSDTLDVDGEVTIAVAPVVLEHAFGRDRLHWVLTSVGSGTELTLWHTLDAEPDLAKMAAGWHLCLLVAERYLDGTPIGRIVGPNALNFGFEQLEAVYHAVLDPAADE